MNSANPKLDPSCYRLLVRQALAEDIGSGDVTTNAMAGQTDRARGLFVAKSPLTLAGCDVALEAFAQLDPKLASAFRFGDGDEVPPGAIIGEITGTARALLSAERTALNFLQHLSGVATLTREFVRASGGRITLLDTRKTTPGFRVLEKYAVRAGGGTNHRMGLDDGVLIKDNHIRHAGRGGCRARRPGGHPAAGQHDHRPHPRSRPPQPGTREDGDLRGRHARSHS
jgi:nicotinate-nucleotide pyrophosphorylase (carboxylating)